MANRLKSDNGTPVLPPPSRYRDPTKQGPKVKAAIRKINGKMRRIAAGVERIVRSIPEKRNVTNAQRYEFDVNPAVMRQVNLALTQLLNQQLLSGLSDYEREFWFDSFVRTAYEAGTNDAVDSAARMSAAAGATEITQTLEGVRASVAFDAGLINRANLVGARSFELMRGLSDTMRADLASTLSNSIANGDGIRDTVKAMRDRVGVGGSRAARIARTEIHGAYRNATRRETDVLNEDVFDDSDFEMRMLWFSALASTTRRTHARRHGNAYTTAEVDRFYSKDGNAINCYCSQSNVLVNKRTGEIMQEDLKSQMEAQRKRYFKDPDDAQPPGETIDPDTVKVPDEPVSKYDSVYPDDQARLVRMAGMADADTDAVTASNMAVAFGGGEYDKALEKLEDKQFKLFNLETGSGAYYNDRSRGINMGSNAAMKTGDDVLTYVHEFGHAYDYASGNRIDVGMLTPWRSPFSSSKQYQKAINADRKAWRADLKRFSGYRYGQAAKEFEGAADGLTAKNLIDVMSERHLTKTQSGMLQKLADEMGGVTPKNFNFFKAVAEDMAGMNKAGFGDNRKANALILIDSNAYFKLEKDGYVRTMLGHLADTVEATTDYRYGWGHGKSYYNKRVKHNRELARGTKYTSSDISDARNVEAFAQIFTTFHKEGKQLQWLFAELFPKQFKEIEDLLNG